jgi:hypothetical protein
MIPVVCPSDRAAIDGALFTLRRTPLEQIRAVRIPDTLHLERLQVSAAYLNAVRERTHLL